MKPETDTCASDAGFSLFCRCSQRAGTIKSRHPGDYARSAVLTRGVGVHRNQLTAFEYALREADVEQQNLVTVSSILPAGCELITAEVGIVTLHPGEITFCVMARA